MIEKVKPDINQIPVFTGLVGGQPKSGKTTGASTFPNALILDLDLGAELVSCERIAIDFINPPVKVETNDKDVKIKKKIPPTERGYVFKAGDKKGEPMPVYSLSEVYVSIQHAIKQGKFSYQTVVIDTLDALNALVEHKIMKEMRINSMGEAGFGQDYGAAKKKNLEILDNFISMCHNHGISVLLICHTAQKTQLGDGTTQQKLELPRGFANAIEADVEFIGHVTRSIEGYPQIEFKSYSEVQAGSRIDALDGKTIKWDYETFKTTIEEYDPRKEKVSETVPN